MTWPSQSHAASEWQGKDLSPSLLLTETLAVSWATVQSRPGPGKGVGREACGSLVSWCVGTVDACCVYIRGLGVRGVREPCTELCLGGERRWCCRSKLAVLRRYGEAHRGG